jgi:hypothetical protein
MAQKWKVKCPKCRGDLKLLPRGIWIVEFSVGAEAREPREAKVYSCSSCKIDMVFLEKQGGEGD